MKKIFFIAYLTLLIPILLMSQTASVVFSHPGGFYENSFNLELRCDGAYHIRYTTNGGSPTAHSTLYEQPLFLDESLYSKSRIHTIVDCIPSAFYETDDVMHSIVIRAALFDDNDSCVGDVKTNSYFIRSLGCDIQKMPVVSIVTDSLSLFDYNTGIFVPGVHYDTVDPRHTGNYYQRGDEWERKINFEFYEQSNFGINQQCGLRTHGNASRWFQQKGMKLYAREEYGKKRFKYPFFENPSLCDFKHLCLHPFRCSVWLETGAQEFIAHRVASNLNVDAMAVREVSVFINGEYWGIYTLEESPDERYLEDHYDVDLEQVNVIKYFCVQEYGDYKDWMRFFDWIQHSDLSLPEDSAVAFSRIDVPSFIDYMVFETFSANIDWPFNNVRIWQPATGEQFRFLFFDGDGCFIRLPFAALENATNSGDNSYVLNHFLQNESFKIAFKNRYAELKSSFFRYDFMKNYLDEYRRITKNDIPKQSQRFGFPKSVSKWEYDMGTVDSFLKNRYSNYEDELEDFLSVEENLVLNYCYPNPSSGVFVISFYSNTNETAPVRIYDCLGRLVWLDYNKIEPGNNLIKFNVDLEPGLYIVKLGKSTKRIIIK
ncbi:MAG: CotH kinase family protein [Bacteroidales bacterium]|nr:CotH kinase family protein [Bacteroidales bacterium]